MQFSFDNIMLTNVDNVNKTEERIGKLEQKVRETQNEMHIEIYKKQIADAKRILRIQEALVKYARLPKEEDVQYRAEIIKWFPESVKLNVPDDLPLVFHGTNNIGQVRQIIQTNGLLTPEQRGESMTSFATQIDVGAKTNIYVPCEFAESHYPWMPYGAIFAFLPKPEEIDKVNKTGDSTEVFGGVDGVDFKKEPERLFGIITTPENIEQIKQWCEESNIDTSKVLIHSEFIKYLEELQFEHKK